MELHAQAFNYKRCVRDSLCAEVRVSYPIVKSPDAAVAKRLSDSLQMFIASILTDAEESTENIAGMSLQQRLEKMGPRLLENLRTDFGEDTAITVMSYTVEGDYRIVHETPQYASLEATFFLMLGGAQGLNYTALKTFQKSTGRSVSIEDITSDTKAFLSLIEQAFLKTISEPSIEPEHKKEILARLKEQPLPMPENFCIVADGIHVLYNQHETPFGPSDFTLTWEQLGKLTSADKWLK